MWNDIISIPNLPSTKQITITCSISKRTKDQEFCFCGGSEKRHFEGLWKGQFPNFCTRKELVFPL